jgi:hypothetical protein
MDKNVNVRQPTFVRRLLSRQATCEGSCPGRCWAAPRGARPAAPMVRPSGTGGPLRKSLHASHSTDRRCGVSRAMCGATESRPVDRTRVVSTDW